MSGFLTLLCLLQHGRVDLELASSQAAPRNSDNDFVFLPFWHDRLAPNTCAAVLSANNPLEGRLRGQAFGISDPLRNHGSSVGARFTFSYVIDPSQVTSGALHRFMVETRTRGVFEHFAAVPFSSDNRQPSARTLATGRTTIEVHELDFRRAGFPRLLNIAEGGVVLHQNGTFPDSNDGSHTDIGDEVLPNNALIRVLNDHRVHIGQKFRPSGIRPIRVRVRREISAQAIGVFSDVQVRGIGVASLRTRVLQAYFQKVPEPGDVCFPILSG